MDSRALTDLRAVDFDAVLFPGGFGAAKHLSDFAVSGGKARTELEVARVIREFHAARKPIGLCCIAPVLAANVLGKASGGPGVKVTIGNDSATADAINGFGSTHESQPESGVCVDEEQNVLSTPAYMYDAPLHTVFEGIGNLLDQVLARAGPAAAPR